MERKVNKVRNWFLTINQEAECFNEVKTILANYEKAEFSAILHDKDNAEQPHWHVCILFKNARTFETMQNTFKGAHIEVMESKYNCFRYLLHLDDKDKFQYDIKEVFERGNNTEYYIEHDEYIKLDTESLIEHIKNGEVRTFYDAVMVFGLKQCTTYRNSINQILEERRFIGCIYTTEDEVNRLRYSLTMKDESIEALSNRIEDEKKRIQDLESINNQLLKRIRQLEEYEKIIKERGLI